MERGRRAAGRFAHLCREMEVQEVRCVATAAVRDAENGDEFIRRAREMGLEVELLTGGQEAVAVAHGVLSGIPGADGIVGDLGGGRSEEHTSELQSLMRISYAVFCLKKKKNKTQQCTHHIIKSNRQR